MEGRRRSSRIAKLVEGVKPEPIEKKKAGPTQKKKEVLTEEKDEADVKTTTKTRGGRVAKMKEESEPKTKKPAAATKRGRRSVANNTAKDQEENIEKEPEISDDDAIPQKKTRKTGAVTVKEKEKENQNQTTENGQKNESDDDPAMEVDLSLINSADETVEMRGDELNESVESDERNDKKRNEDADDDNVNSNSRPTTSMSNRPRRSVASRRVSYVDPKLEDSMITLSSSSSEVESASDDDEMSFEVRAADSEEKDEDTGKSGADLTMNDSLMEEVKAKSRAKPQAKSSGTGKDNKRKSFGGTANGKNQKQRKSYRPETDSSSDDDGGSSGSKTDDSFIEHISKGGKSQKSIANGRKSFGGGGGAKRKVAKSSNGKAATDKGDPNWPKCRPASINKKTGNPANSGVVKSGLRMANKVKPQQPWKKNISEYEQDRRMGKGERRMLEYRIIAKAYAKGKLEEVSYDECYKIHEGMKQAYKEGRKLIEAIEKREREEDTGEKESSSEDEWEEMEHFQPVIDAKGIEVTLDKDDENIEKDWWVVYLRQEVNKRIRMVWESTHKVHLLCYMYHLNFVVKTALDESLVPSLIMSQLPSGYMKYIGEGIPLDVLQKLVKWYADAFRPLNGVMSVTAIEEDLKVGQEARYPATSRLTALVDSKSYETDLDRAVLLFCLLVGMECTARVCVNVKAISRKWDKGQQAEITKEMETFRELSRSRSHTPSESTKNSNADAEKKDAKTKKGDGKKAKGESKTKKPAEKAKKKAHEERNYWVEYWYAKEKRWICIDPLTKTVDEPLKIHEDAAAPMTYVFAIDNKRGICEVSQRYAMDCVKQDFRRRRTDPVWLAVTLRTPVFAANQERVKYEKMQMHEDLVKRPLPTTMSEYKNHPLYVLEKDLLKFEALYPPPSKQKPLGQIRGHNVYPRSCVFTLQGENNWIKLARSIKIGEKPYKVVKARPDPRIPVEQRVDQFLDVFGYWQTEPYRRPKVTKGQIPRNEYGNVYMFNENMVPIGCTYLKLPGLVQISRKLDKQCVQAVVGWAFDGGYTHPVMDGAIVLEKDADVFVAEWNRLEKGRAEREEKKRRDRVYENWKKLIKGMLRLQYVRKQFGGDEKLAKKRLEDVKLQDKIKKPKGTKKQKKEEENEEMDHGEGPSTSGQTNVMDEEEIIDNSATKQPLEGFSLDDFISAKK